MSQPIKLPKLLQEGCVLQRGEKTRIWGWYKPQAELEVTFQEKVYRTNVMRKEHLRQKFPVKNRWSLCVEHKK